MNNRFGQFGFFKALIAAFPLLLACMVSTHADPIFTPTLLISLAVSAALSAASIGLQMLFQPKPKPVDKNKLQGDVRLTTVGEDIPIPEPFGAALGDGIGGYRLGGIIFYASQIRKTVVTTSSGQSSGGGKGAPKSPPTREYHYFIDLAILIGRGPLRVKQVKANSDVLYQDFSTVGNLAGTVYEAESATGTSGGTGTLSDADFSGGAAATIPDTKWVEWNNVISTDDSAPVEMYIAYKSTQDVDVLVTLNGGTAQAAVLPDSFGLVAHINLPQTLPVGTNTVRIQNVTSGVTLDLDCITVGMGSIFVDPGGGGTGPGCYLSGTQYLGYNNPEPSYDYQTLRDPLAPDPRGCNEFNYQANPNARGEVDATLTGGGGLRWYPGNKTQLPDPMLQAYFEGLYGAGSTPAFRNRCYVVLENFEITKYGSVPNFTFVVEHETVNSLGEMFAARAARAGLQPAEYDFTALNAAPLRGYCVTQKQAPAKEMELLCRVYDVDVYESFDGVITGVVPSETVVAAVPADELAAEENKETTSTDNKPFAPVTTTFRDERDLPFFLDASFFNPTKDWEPGNVHSLREIASSGDRKENIETGIVFTEAEAQKFVDRELHKIYVEKDGLQAKMFHKYSYLVPTDLISVEDADGSVNNMRIKAIDGWLPGALDVRGVSRDAVEYPPRLFVVANPNPVITPVSPPAPLVGTFIDLALFDEQANPGFYVAAAVTDPHYQWKGASLYRLGASSEWEALAGLPNQAVMGRTIAGSGGVLADVPGGWAPGDWDDVATVTIDLYNGELETLTDAQVIDDKRNFLVVGDEIIQFGTATLVGGSPNRWTVSHLQRRLMGTDSTSHASAERAVLQTGAWRYIEQDPTLAGTTRTYKFVGAGGDLNTASSVDFNWQGRTLYNQPIYNTVDNGVPVLDTDVPTVGLEGGNWHIFIHRPIANGFSADRAEIRVRRAGDDVELRHIDIGNSIDGIVLAPLDQSKVDYRWQNKYRLFGSDGWSAWSAYAVANGTSGGTQPPVPPVITTDPNDPGDPTDVNPVCFIDGTEVLMADWTVKAIQDVAEGDFVMAWGPQGRLMPARVAGTRREKVSAFRDLELTGDRLGVTEFHPFCADWKLKLRVKDMDAGQTVRAWAKEWGFETVVSNSRKRPKGGVFVNNFEVETWHTYMVRGGKGASSWKAVYNRKLDPYNES